MHTNITKSFLTVMPSLSFIDTIKNKLKKIKFEEQWAERNTKHGELFATTIRMDYKLFQRNIFIEGTDKLIDQLDKMGFVVLNEYPHSKLFNNICVVMYNEKYNIAISLYSSKYKDVFNTAFQISDTTQDIMNTFAAMVTFTSIVDTLIKKMEE